MKRALPIIFFLVLSTPFWDLGHPLWEVDDARYAEVPREMAASGDWLTPTLNFMDYVEKPPLIYWLGAASYKIFGVSEAAARVPLALLAVLGMLGAWWLGNWLYGKEVAVASAVLLGTCAQYYALSHNITPDMAVSVALLWTTGLILRCLRQPKNGARWGALAWVAAACAFLAKGLIGLLLPAVWTGALILLFPKLRQGLRPLILNWGPIVFVAAIGGWFAAMESRNPGFFNFFVIEQHFQRFLTPKYNRPGGWAYFIPVELAGSLPWTPLIAAAVIAPLARWRRSDERDRQLALWVVIVFGFFSASSSKLLTYILPLFAHQAVLGAQLLSRLDSETSIDRWIRRGAALLAVVLALAIPAGLLILPRIDLPFPVPAGLRLCAAGFLVSLAAASAVLARARRSQGGLPVLVMGAGLSLAALALLIPGTRQLTAQLSAKALALEINRQIETRGGPPARIFSYDIYLHAIPFYTGRPVDVVNWVGELHYAKRFERFAHRFADENALRALPDPERITFVALRRKSVPRLLALNPNEKPASLKFYGPWALAVY